MDQLLSIAQDASTILLPIVLILFIGVAFLSFKLLITVNKTAGAVKETTFMVNGIIQHSIGWISQFVMNLFDTKKKA